MCIAMAIIWGRNEWPQPWYTVLFVAIAASFALFAIVQAAIHFAQKPDLRVNEENGTPVKPAPCGGSTVKVAPTHGSGCELLFHTLGANARPLPTASLPEGHQVISQSYDPHICPQKALFEIVVSFSLHNHTDETVRLYDTHARLYYSICRPKPTARFDARLELPRHRIDLLSDNSIFGNGLVHPVSPGDALYIDLAMEASFYDNKESVNVMAFGLEVDVEASADGRGVANYRIPSEKIYVMEYDGDNSLVIRDLNGAAIQAAIEAGENPDYPILLHVWDKHTNTHLQKLD